MPDHEVLDPNTGVAQVFTTIVATLAQLDWQQEAPDVFLVYAHDNDTLNQPANADIACHIIEWLHQVGANIYSDRTSMGNPPIPKATPVDTAKSHDILSSQLGLLPTNHFIRAEDKRQRIILCGSALLNHYASSDYYQKTYYPGFKRAYQSAKQQTLPANAKKVLSDYVNSHLNNNGFHHVLTELACLELRNQSEPDSHCIVPIALNNRHQAVFPNFTHYSTTIRILDRCWQDQKTYQDQGLHEGFFRLLDRLWEHKMHIIQVMAKNVYTNCLRSLGTQGFSEQKLSSVILKEIQDAQQELVNKGCATLRVMSTQELLNTIREAVGQRSNHSTFEVEKKLSKWYPTLEKDLSIQRISREPLRIEHCYIELAVVECQSDQEKKEANSSTQLSHRRKNSTTATNTKASNQIRLDDLFKSRRLKNGTTGIPKCILIRGRAGIGKTTLVKKIVYDHIKQGFWQQFEQILWIPLRRLKGKPSNYQPETLLYDNYFDGHLSDDATALARALLQKIEKNRFKTLFILDGWDEIAEQQSIACLEYLVKHPRVIITSRPHGFFINLLNNIELELETVGFSEVNIISYLDNPHILRPTLAKEIRLFIQQHPFIRELVKIPIQLDALCFSWEKIKKDQKEISTLTKLYQLVIEELWRKDIIRLGKKENGVDLTQEVIQSISRFNRLERFVEEEISFLESLALNGLYQNQIEFSREHLDEIIAQLEKEPQAPLSSALEGNIEKLSCLRMEKEKHSERISSCQFLHLTFQEFFAAQSLAKALTRNKSLSLLKQQAIKPEEFIRQCKYDPRYEVVYWFIAGLLKGDALIKFFKLLDEEPQDLIGIHHQYLLMHCSRESCDELPEDRQTVLRSHLSDWLNLEITVINHSQEANRISYLGSRYAFPESLLIEVSEKKDMAWVKETIANTLGMRHGVSENAIQTLVEWCKDTDLRVKKSSVRALGGQLHLPTKAQKALVELLQDKDSEVQDLSTKALIVQSYLDSEAQKDLIKLSQYTDSKVQSLSIKVLLEHGSTISSDTFEALIPLLQNPALSMRISGGQFLERRSSLDSKVRQGFLEQLQDEDSTVRASAVLALGEQSGLSLEDQQQLFPLLQDKDANVQEAAARILGSQSSMVPATQKALITLLQDKDPTVKASAVLALGKQSNLSVEDQQQLLPLLQDRDANVQEAAARILGSQSSMAPATQKFLITLLQDKDPTVKVSAVLALGKQSNLSVGDQQQLIPLLQDKDATVKTLTAEALGKQSSLSPESQKALLTLLQDEDSTVKASAVLALSEQLNLPLQNQKSLLPLLKDKDSWVRASTVLALGTQSSLAEDIQEALLPLLEDRDTGIQESASTVLGKQLSIAPRVQKGLTEQLQHTNSEVKYWAAFALGRQSNLNPETQQSLLLLIQDRDVDVRTAAAEALQKQQNIAQNTQKSLIAQLEHTDLDRVELINQILNHQGSWNVYQWLPNMDIESLRIICLQWIFLHNFKQPTAIYLKSGELCFYTSKGLKTVPLNEQEIPFKQAILQARRVVGIPNTSQTHDQYSFWRQSIEFYYPSFPMPGAWPVVSEYEAGISL